MTRQGARDSTATPQSSSGNKNWDVTGTNPAAGPLHQAGRLESSGGAPPGRCRPIRQSAGRCSEPCRRVHAASINAPTRAAIAPARTLRQTSVRQRRRGPPKTGAAGPAPCGWGLPGFRARRRRRPELAAISMASARRTARAAQRQTDALRGTRRTGGTQGVLGGLGALKEYSEDWGYSRGNH